MNPLSPTHTSIAVEGTGKKLGTSEKLAQYVPSRELGLCGERGEEKGCEIRKARVRELKKSLLAKTNLGGRS